MPKIRYQDHRFSGKVQATIVQANAIIAEYMEQGFDLTLRQLYYQFVARDLLENNAKNYKRLGETLNNARLAGLVDWNAIVDRTRNLRALPSWDTPTDIIASCAQQFRTDRWSGQPYRVEVWIEKDALMGVIQGVCNELHVPYFSCRGYTSQSEMWAAGQRIASHLEEGQRPLILHFGDHDPSGIDMTRDIEERLEMFTGSGIQVDRLALNFDQVQEYNPPPNFAKEADSRHAKYLKLYGEDCWELDALDPKVLAGLVRDSILNVRDEDAWDLATAEDMKARQTLGVIARNWAAVKTHVEESEYE